LEEVQDSAPPILPEFIEEGADRQIANWQKIFGDEFVDIINAMEAVKTGDVQTFVRSGVNILKVTPEVLPRLGLDLIIPINDNYLGGAYIDPAEFNSGVEVGSQKIEIKDLETANIESLILDFALSGYNVDSIKIKRIVNEDYMNLITEEIKVRTDLPIKFDEGKLFVVDRDSNEEKKIKKLPSYAAREVKTRYKKFKEDDVKLEIIDEKAKYIIDGKIDGKILWLIPIQVDASAEYNAEKGSLDKVTKPWWEIFVF